jgi:hypothetical protein
VRVAKSEVPRVRERKLIVGVKTIAHVVGEVVKTRVCRLQVSVPCARGEFAQHIHQLNVELLADGEYSVAPVRFEILLRKPPRGEEVVVPRDHNATALEGQVDRFPRCRLAD